MDIACQFQNSVSERKTGRCALTEYDPVENAKTVTGHFQKVCNTKSELDPEVLSKIEQTPIRFEMDDSPDTR